MISTCALLEKSDLALGDTFESLSYVVSMSFLLFVATGCMTKFMNRLKP